MITKNQMEKVFNLDLIKSTVTGVIEKVVENNNYQHNKVDEWGKLICEGSMNHLVNHNGPYKYIVNCVIVEKNGAGINSSTSCYWDKETDFNCTIRWENKNVHCITQVFALAI